MTPLPGTTRDYLEAGLELAGVPVTLVDTAGLRETEDLIEAAGVRQAVALAGNADLVLVLEDGSQPREPLPTELPPRRRCCACGPRPICLPLGPTPLPST